ncbi:tRNA methyltransferase [Baekduia alba]|uniref:class I SAM-dependent DNA methyltransferase n=1 Tax=Baekduia alba TaxID=2997333 RepID=UPI002341DCE3|nr:class I SAM-dependent methyltransferase [Baekduia alba]WCB93594.1 tRNA methyltransferase [Baekduia alba]
MTLLGSDAIAEKETVAAPYDPLAPHYDAFNSAPEYEDWLAALLQLAAEHGLDGGLALDVGCGTGRSVAALLSAGFEASGVDPSPGMLEVARERLGAGVELGVSTLPEPLPIGPKLDLVTAFGDVLNYIEPEMLSRSMTVLADRLRPGGLLLFDANTQLVFTTFFGTAHVRDAGERFFVWDPLAQDDPTYSADLHAFVAAPDGDPSGWIRTVSRHVQHRHPHERIVEALDDAGLELLTTRGAHESGELDLVADDARHIKRIYLARLS